VAFSPVHPNLIFGGTYAGQVLMWDTRSNQLPVLKTPLSAGGHTYPIYSMQFVGSHNASNLVTASTDGTVCTWMGDLLTIPQVCLPRLSSDLR
jgi:dynein intermediate chain